MVLGGLSLGFPSIGRRGVLVSDRWIVAIVSKECFLVEFRGKGSILEYRQRSYLDLHDCAGGRDEGNLDRPYVADWEAQCLHTTFLRLTDSAGQDELNMGFRRACEARS